MTSSSRKATREAPNWTDSLERVDRERKHLEGLLKDRIHFYLVFAGLFFAGLYKLDEPMKRTGLVVGTIVSILLCLGILRTFRLVIRALKDVEKIDPTHPFIRYRKGIWFPPNANYFLVGVPIVLTCLFCQLTWLSPRQILQTAQPTAVRFEASPAMTSAPSPEATLAPASGR